MAWPDSFALIHGSVVDIYLDVLSVVAEGLAEDGQTAHMFRVIVHCEAETEAAAVIQMEAVDGHVGNFQTVDKGAPPVDDEKLQQSVLVPVGKPPVGGEEPAGITKISRREPVPDTHIV